MKLSIVFRLAAHAEYADAARWYENRANGVGYRFVERVEQAISVVAESPHRPKKLFADVRRTKVRGFPFFVYYIVEDARIVVIAVLHARRNPATWRRFRS